MQWPTLDQDGFPQLPAGRNDMVGAVSNGRMHMSGRMMTPSGLLSGFQLDLGTGRLVDKTGLTGKYDFKLEYSSVGLAGPFAGAGPPPASLDNVSDPAPDLFTALEKQLGLKLEKTKAPLDVIVIDRIEKAPTDN